MEAFKAAEKDVADAEAKLSAAEAAATAKRTEVKATGVQVAVELLQQAAATKCGDSALAAQVAAALQQIANVRGAITAPTAAAAATDESAGASTGAPPAGKEGKGEGSGAGEEKHLVSAVRGDTDAKSRRTLPLPQEPVALVGPAVAPDPGTQSVHGTGSGHDQFAGGAVDGEVVMGTEPHAGEGSDEGLLSQAAAALGDDDSAL